MKNYKVRELLEIIGNFNNTRIVDIKLTQGGTDTGTVPVLLNILSEEILNSNVEDFYPDAIMNSFEIRAPHFVIVVNDL